MPDFQFWPEEEGGHPDSLMGGEGTGFSRSRIPNHASLGFYPGEVQPNSPFARFAEGQPAQVCRGARPGEAFERTAKYDRLGQYMALVDSAEPINGLESFVIPFLSQVWLNDYTRYHRHSDIVETTTAGFSYLFDIARERLIAAWGVSAGKNTEKRDSGRMAGHPLSNGPLYHRGHAIAHTLGGQTDINLVPQLGKINIGPFRRLEKKAVATPGSLYFTYWIYSSSPRPEMLFSQTPVAVDQGLLIAGMPPDITYHRN